jgi:hypothetical protein
MVLMNLVNVKSYDRVMTEPTNIPIDLLVHVAAQRRRNAQRKMEQARQMNQQSLELEREATRELQEVEAFERLFQQAQSILRHGRPPEVLELESAAQQLSAVDRVRRKILEDRQFRSQRDQVAEFAAFMLEDREWMSTNELVDAMKGRNIQLTAADPAARVSQILSQDDRFQNQRGRGWALVKRPVNETPSESTSEDEQIKARARELARDDGNNARDQR